MRAVYVFLMYLLSSVVSLKASAQELFRAVYETYGSYMKEDKERHKGFPMVLEVGSGDTFFYDLGRMLADSVTHATLLQNNSSYEAQKARNNVAQGSLPTYVSSHFVEQEREVDQAIDYDFFSYKEPLDRPEWEINDSLMVFKGGYPCHRATTTYLGRQWTVWYTLEIPSPAGPWKLWGLPGLIVEARESEGIFSFTLTSFTKMRPEDSKRGYASTLGFGKKIKADKAEVFKLLRYYISDPIGYYNIQNPDTPAELMDASKESFRETFVNIEK
ncbi:GLPGLI family protein [Porphyromonas cangingivalis]|nr:GLPGLI family protein [Porphyromonas cangingivalis]